MVRCISFRVVLSCLPGLSTGRFISLLFLYISVELTELGQLSDVECTVAIGKAKAACAQSFALWQQGTTEIMRRNHSIIACSRHIYLVLFFAHIPFVLNHTFNATPTERLQYYHAFDEVTGSPQFQDHRRALCRKVP